MALADFVGTSEMERYAKEERNPVRERADSDQKGRNEARTS